MKRCCDCIHIKKECINLYTSKDNFRWLDLMIAGECCPHYKRKWWKVWRPK